MRETALSKGIALASSSALHEVLGAWCRGEPTKWQAVESAGWQRVVEEAQSQGVSGLLYHLLPQQAPPIARGALAAEYRSQLAANILYLDWLRQIIPALRDAGIRFAVVKGAALLATVYPDLGIRGMEDADLLVHPDDVNLLRSVLQHLGWQEEDEDVAGRRFGERYRGETSFIRFEGSMLMRLEGHLDAPGFYPRSRHRIWERITLVSGAGIEGMPVLQLPVHLSYLCAHYCYHHCGRGLKWLVDIALLLTQITSWHDVVVEAYHFGTTRPLHYALQETARRLQMPVPQHILETLRLLPMPLTLRLLFELCKRPAFHYVGIRLLDIYRAPHWSVRLGYIGRKLFAPRWRIQG